MFSVVIPLFNKASTIKRTISSVLAQDLSQFEILIVDDGSTDNGANIIEQSYQDSRIRIIRQENLGVSAARNKGVACSHYQYVAFLDGDDEWAPTFLSTIKTAIEKFPQAGMYGSASWHRNITTGQGTESTLTRYRGKIQLVNYFDNPGTMPHTSATVVAKTVFDSISENGEGFPHGMKCCEDWSCFYRMALLAPVTYVGLPLGVRNTHVAGQTTGLSKDDRFTLLKHVVRFYNTVYAAWANSLDRNKDFKVYFKYDIRARIMSALRTDEFRTVEYLLQNLDQAILDEFHPFEVQLYRQKNMTSIAMCHIYLTKLWWRRLGYPIVGKN